MTTKKELNEIWFVSPNFAPLWAGPSERFFRYAHQSEEHGLKITFKTYDRGVNKAHQVIDGIDVYRYKTENYTEYLEAVASEIEAGQRPKGVIVISLGKAIPSFTKRLRKCGVKSAHVSTMDFDLEYRDNGKKRGFLRKFLYTLYFKKMVHSFDMIVASSTFLADQYNLKLGVPKDRLLAIPNGVNTEVFKPEPENVDALREELGLPKDEMVFLFVGLLVERKGMIDLLTSWMAYKENGGKGYLAIVGTEKRYVDDEGYFAKYRELRGILEEGNHNMKFHGASTEIHKFFKAADAFVFLSRLEGMPNVLMEAMACGLPIMMNKFKAFSDDYGTDGVHFKLVKGNDVKSVTTMMTEFEQNPDMRKEIGRNSVELVNEKFLVVNSIKKYAKLF